MDVEVTVRATSSRGDGFDRVRLRNGVVEPLEGGRRDRAFGSVVKLTRIEVRNYRSLFVDGSGKAVTFDIGEGMNAFIGPNNCGKSNLLRAVALALDPAYAFNRDRDMSAPLMFTVPRITLTFSCEGRTSPERTLLRYVDQYEKSTGRGTKTYADEGVLRFVVSYPGNERSGATRQEAFGARGAGAQLGDPGKLEKAIGQFRKCLRFIMIESGESLESVLQGKFREILHTVIREHLREEFASADRRRSGYVEGLTTDLLAPLRERIGDVVCQLFPDISDVSLVPQVSSIDDTLSNVAVNLTDAVETGLAAKGTGVRGAVMVAMLRYLADHGRRSMVFAVEEPEAFLHPAAQEDLRDDLEALGERPDVSLLVTTHSPFIVSRDAKARVTAMAKDPAGRTLVTGTAQGDEPHASLLGGLFRDAILADVLERARVPGDAKGVVVVEGRTDAEYLRIAARVSGRPDLLEGLHIAAGEGATMAVAQAIITRAETPRPLIVILDNDEPGRHARRQLTDNFGFQNRKDVISYAEVFGPDPGPVEAEDLFSASLIDEFVRKQGENLVLTGKWRRKDGKWHYDLTKVGKETIVPFVADRATAADVTKWISLLELARQRLGLA